LCKALEKYYLCPSIFNKLHPLQDMGKGDPRSKRGKISRGSHGNARPKLQKLKTILKKLVGK